MKKQNKSSLGVTMLEIMLVLAIAAMVIVMSVRYYRTTSGNQQSNAVLQMIQAIQANADVLSQESGTYNAPAATAATTANIAPMMPSGSMAAPWGDTVTVTDAAASSYKVTFPNMPNAVCVGVYPRIAGNTTNYSGLASDCTAAAGRADFSYTFTK